MLQKKLHLVSLCKCVWVCVCAYASARISSSNEMHMWVVWVRIIGSCGRRNENAESLVWPRWLRSATLLFFSFPPGQRQPTMPFSLAPPLLFSSSHSLCFHQVIFIGIKSFRSLLTANKDTNLGNKQHRAAVQKQTQTAGEAPSQCLFIRRPLESDAHGAARKCKCLCKHLQHEQH